MYARAKTFCRGPLQNQNPQNWTCSPALSASLLDSFMNLRWEYSSVSLLLWHLKHLKHWRISNTRHGSSHCDSSLLHCAPQSGGGNSAGPLLHRIHMKTKHLSLNFYRGIGGYLWITYWAQMCVPGVGFAVCECHPGPGHCLSIRLLHKEPGGHCNAAHDWF